LNVRNPDSMNDFVSSVLRTGVLLSAAIIIVGTILALARYGPQEMSEFLQYLPNQVPHGTYSVDLADLGAGLLVLDPFSIIELGVIALLATPVARVLMSVFLFAAEGDRTYVYVTAGVLVLLLFSILVTPQIPLFHA
jgi:uncharacterized membrane protein